MSTPLLTALCGCCDPPAPPAPALVTNRPGLTALAYRVGTFATFREAMLEAIARQPALHGLTTRQSEDTAITLLELWAAVADVLTFYQERIANEAFLRTAVERDSVLRLVRLLDYHLRPGLAATTHLAFTVNDGATVRIPVGLRVMSTPGQDERPQTFEATATILADARLNRLPVLPQPIVINPLAQGRQTAFLTADTAGWQAARSLRPGEKVVLFHQATTTRALARRTSAHTTTAAMSATSPTYGETLGWDVPPRVSTEPMMWGPQANVRQDVSYWAGQAQPLLPALGNGASPDPNAPEEKEIKEVLVEGDRFLLAWTTPIIKDIWTADTPARVFTQKMRLFGYDAPAVFASVIEVEDTATDPPTNRASWSSEDVNFTIGETSVLLLDRTYKDLVVGDELLIYTPLGSPQVATVTALSEGEEILGTLPGGSLADQRYRATVTRATVAPPVTPGDRRAVTVYRLKGPQLPLWSGDFPDLITSGRLCLPAVRLDPAGDSVEIGRTVSGGELQSGVALRRTDIDLGRIVLLQDHTQQPVLATITACSVLPFVGQDFLVLDVTATASIQLETRTAVLLGNVTPATHGETVPDEILGHGDAATPFQRFVLRRTPLTYVPSARSARGESTLRLLVNGVQWSEASSLYGQPPTATVYTARQADDGTTVVQFGDGSTGARLPSGQGNVIGTYRQGSGLAGRLQAEQLNILLDRPVGLKAALNPAATEGGADPETLDRARQTAPTTVKTFGRAISLLDFASLATASGEVAKATATWVWRGLEKAVHLTVAGQEGGLFSTDSLARLHSGLTQQRDPNHTLLLANFCRVPILVRATLEVDSRYVRDDVLQAARQALLAALSFEAVAFAQPVHLSDIYRVLQDIAGVVFVDINTLHFKGYVDWTAEQLAARGATSAPVQNHLRIFAARPRPGPQSPTDPVVSACFGSNPLPEVLPAEQAYIQVAATDITPSATGGLQ